MIFIDVTFDVFGWAVWASKIKPLLHDSIDIVQQRLYLRRQKQTFPSPLWYDPYDTPLSNDRSCLTTDPRSDRTFWSDPWSDRVFGGR